MDQNKGNREEKEKLRTEFVPDKTQVNSPLLSYFCTFSVYNIENIQLKYFVSFIIYLGISSLVHSWGRQETTYMLRLSCYYINLINLRGNEIDRIQEYC